MSSGIDARRHGKTAWWGAGVVALFLTAVAALCISSEFSSPALIHLFYFPVLAGAFFFAVPGGVIVGLSSGLLAGPVGEVLLRGAATTPTLDWAIWSATLAGVGYFAGRALETARRREAELNTVVDDTITAFVHAIRAADGSTAAHSQKVAEYAVAIARELKLEPELVEQVRRAALLHDVGKLAVPKEILNKPGPLDPEEWEVIRRHPEVSEGIVACMSHLKPLLPAVRHHHERLDGRGYPDGVKGGDLPLEARIIAVADAFDAMTSRRSYREPMSEQAAVEQLLKNVGSQFDPVVVDAFLRARSISYSAEEVFSQLEALETTVLRKE